MFIDERVAVVGDQLVTVNESGGVEVHLLHSGQVVNTIRTGDDGSNQTMCITPVPGHSDLIVTGHENGAVHLWDIDKGARACESTNVNAGVHVRRIVQLIEKPVYEMQIVASSTQLMCKYGFYYYDVDDDDGADDRDNKRQTNVAIVHFDDEK